MPERPCQVALWVEIYQQNAHPHPVQEHSQVSRSRGLAHSALLIRERDHDSAVVLGSTAVRHESVQVVLVNTVMPAHCRRGREDAVAYIPPNGRCVNTQPLCYLGSFE